MISLFHSFFFSFWSLTSLSYLSVVMLIFLKLLVWELSMSFSIRRHCSNYNILKRKVNFCLLLFSIYINSFELICWFNMFTSLSLLIQVTFLFCKWNVCNIRMGLISSRNRISVSFIYQVLRATDSILGLLLFSYHLILSDFWTRNLKYVLCNNLDKC